MQENSFKQLLLASVRQVLFILITVNIVNLIVEYINLDDSQPVNLAFLHGYFILNGKQVGINIFSNLITFALIVAVFMYYNSYKAKSRSDS